MCSGGDKEYYFNLEHVDDNEMLARIVFSPSMVVDGRLSPSAFNLARLKSGRYEKYVSVTRKGTEEIDKKDYEYIKPRIEGDVMDGFALVKTADVRSIVFENITIEVKPKPSEKNPRHAGIFYSQDGTLIRGESEPEELLIVTSMLANKCSYHKF